MADFTTSYADGAPNSPVSVQRPVSDQSSLIGLDLATRLINGGASFATDAIRQSQEREASAALNAAVADFATTQLKLADAVELGDMNSQEARMRMRSNYTAAIANNPALAGELAKAQREIIKNTGFGKVVEEGTQQEQIQIAAEREATLNGWVPANADPVTRQASTQAYLQFKRAQDMLADEKARVGLETAYITQETAKISQGTARINQQSSRLTLMEKEQAQRSRVALASMADAYNFRFAQTLDAIKAQRDKGEISPEEAMMMADQQYAMIQQTTSSIGANAGGEYVSNLTAPMKFRYDTMRKYLSGEVSAEVLARNNEVAINLQKANVLGDPTAAQVIAINQLLPHASPNLLATVDTAVVRMLGNQTDDTTKPSDLTTDDPEAKANVTEYLGILKDSLNTLNSGQYYTDDTQEVDRQVRVNLTNVLKSVDAYSASNTDPKAYNQVVDFLASDQFGKYSAANNGAVPVEAAHNARMILDQQYEQQVLPLLREEWERVNIGVGFNPGRGAPQIKSAADMIKPLFTGAGVSFVVNPEFARSSGARARAADLNKEVAPVLNRLIRMSAHLNGDQNYKAAYETKYAQIFGEDLPQPEEEVVE